MGTPLEPAPDYGNNCNTCFPVNKTPVDVYAAVSGVLPGDLYTGAESPCPNGIFKLVQGAACEWETVDFPDILWRPVIGGNSILEITVPDPGLAFTDTKAGNCVQRFVADWQNPALRFHYKGVVQIMTLADLVPISLQVIANLIGVPITTNTMSDFWPATPPDEIIALFARIQDSINILVKQDLTP